MPRSSVQAEKFEFNSQGDIHEDNGFANIQDFDVDSNQYASMGGQAGVILNKLNNNQLAKQKTTNYMANNQYELNSIGQDMGIDLSERDGAGGNRYGVPLQFVLADDQYSQSNNYQSADLDDDAANIVDSVASPEPAKL